MGLAWDPNGDGKQSIRASWGIFFDTPESCTMRDFGASSPWGSTVSLIAPVGGFANPCAGRCQVFCVNVGCPDVFFGPLPGILTGMTEPWIFSYPDRSALRAGPVKTGRRPPKGSLYGSGFSASLGKENLHGAAPGAAMGLPGAALPSKPLLQPFRPADRELAEGFPPPLHGVPLLRYIR